MTKRHELRCYDYVNHPYDQVHDALLADALGIFSRATHSAATRVRDLGAELRYRIGALEISTDVEIEVVEVPGARSPDDRPATRLDLTWRSRRRPGLFPEMAASLWAYALAPRETQIELVGSYDPPLGLLGEAIDAVAMHRIAEATVQRFVSDLASFLRTELPQQPGPGSTFLLADQPM
ncbi:MAG TPA: hypothetical protein VFK02_36315 [Kofleriaceae bacterium]|nr:hypothetical protein [Kofleriaceae bacterium]